LNCAIEFCDAPAYEMIVLEERAGAENALEPDD
jgi:hypothetical protein